MSEFKVEPYRFDANREVVDLLHSVFKPWNGDVDYFVWKFQAYKQDLTTFPLVWIVRDRDKIISFNGFNHRRVKIGNKFYFVVQSFDGATSPLYKGKGLFSKINRIIYDEMRKHNIAWVYGYGNPVMFKILTTKHDWKIWDGQCYLTRILNKDIYLQSRYGSPLIRAAMKIPLQVVSRKRNVRVDSSIEVRELGREGFTDALDHLMESAYEDFHIIGERNSEWLNWCLANPLRRYSAYCAYLDEKIVGYMITTGYEEQNAVRVVDCISKDEQALFAMLNHLEKVARQANQDRINYTINKNHPYIPHFRNFGFLKGKDIVPMASRVINDEDSIGKIVMNPDKRLHWGPIDKLE